MRKKKLIVALIISILCCSLFTSVCLAQENAQKVQDEQEIEMAKKGIESYIAWYTINHGGYDFYMNRFKNPTTTVAERNQNDPEYSASMLLWRVATFQFEKEAEYATSEIGYYETFLFNMLYNDENESFLNEFSDQYSSNIKIFQTVEKALGISAISSVCKAYKELGEEWGLPQNTEDIEKFKKSLQEADNIKDALDIVGDVTDYIGYFKTANDLVNSLARLQSILNASTKEGEILEELSGKSNNNTPMQLALKEYSTYTKEAMSPEEADAIMTGTVVGSEALKEVCKNVFDKTLLAAGGYGFTVMNTGQKVGKFVANTAFNTEAVIAAEYKIDAVYNLNELLREQLKSYEKTFISNPTEKNAQKFNIALKMFYKLQLETMDCYKEFVDAVYNKGLGLNFFRKDLTKEKYQEIIDDISSIKKYISQTMESDRELAVDLYTEILPEINTDLEEDQIPEKLTPVLTDEEKTQTFNNIEYEIMPYSTGVIESDLTLSDDMEVYGDVYLKKGTLNLNGYNLTVNGNLYQEGGSLLVKKGTLEVEGNYYIANISESEAGEEEYGSSQGTLKMMYGEDKVVIHGDFMTKSSYSHSTYLTAGTMYVSGDFRQCIGVSVNFDSSDQHKVVLNGTEPQKIEIDDPNSGFATLDIENSNPITVKGYLRADILETELNKINIESDGMRLVQTTMSDDVEINGDVYLGYSGAVNLKGHKLTVYGNIYHDKSELIIAKGTLEVNGNYYIASISENEAGEEEYGSSQGILKMMYGEDRVIVHGDFLTKSNYSHSTYLTAGTMYVSGDFRQCIGVSVNFDSSDQHKVVLNGTEPQKIEIDDPNSGFATLDIENSNPITVKGYLRADILETELNKINIESDGMRLVQTTMSDDVEINGDVYLGYSGAVNLKGHKLTVYGNIYHDKSELIIAKGTLEVNGNYYIASISENEAGEEEYGSSKGTLKMTYGEDKVVIRGDFMTKSSYSHSTYLTAGTMYVSGDFRQCIGTANNFNSSDQHKVVLNGIKPQKIVFESYDQSHFNILQLTQDKSQYTFNPEPCWNEIQENVKVEPEFDNTLLGYGVCGDDVKWTVNNQGVLHIYGIGVTYDYDPQGKDNVVHTPWEDYNNKIVEVVLDEGITRLGNYLLVGLRNVEQIDIPKTVVSLGNYVFASSGITNQIIPDTVKEIGNGLFARCGQLVDVSFPSAITEIPDYTFNFCLSLTHYIVPKQITKIGKHAFEACLNLQTVDLPEGLEIIEEYAFNTKDSSSSLTEDEWNSRKELASISLPSTLTTIGDFAFRGCCFEEVVIPDNVANYGYGIFEYCEKLKKVTLPKKLEVLSGGFEGCTSLEEIYIPETVIEIGNFAFRYSALKSVKLPEGLERIGMSAFFGCNNMEKIVIPKTVTNIDSGAFCGCENLKTITFCGDAPVEIDCVMGDPRNHTLKNEAYYPANNSTWTEETMKKMGPDATWIPYGMEEVIANGTCGENLKWQLTSEGILNISGTGTMKNYSYKSEMPWFKYLDKINSVVVEEGVTSLGDYAFYGMTNMEEIQLPEGLETIGGYTFKNSQKLNKIELPSTLTKLGESAFYGCTNLTAISIPEGLYTIWAYTFKNCTNLAEVTLPSTLIKIDEAAFYGCSSLKELSIPDSVSIIGIYCFKNCSSLISVDLPAQLTQIREAAFYGTGLTDLEIPEGVTKIDSYAFKNASSITTLSLPESLTKIGEAAFYNSAVHELIIPDSVETIGSYAFKNCISLRNVQLPKGLKQINESSFYGCTSLESLVLPENVTSIGSYAFRKCSSLKNVEFSVDLTTIGESAFYGCERMEELYIPEGVTTIEGYAFKSCVALKEISLPETLENVGESVFHSCVGLSEIVIPASVREIGNYAFSNCVNLDKVYFSGDAPVIGSKAFSKVNILAIYPADNSSWTEEMMQNYGGNIEWIPSDKVLSIEEETYSETVDSAEAGSSEETESDIQEEILEETESIQEEDVLYEEESESEEEIMNTEETENLEKISEILS